MQCAGFSLRWLLLSQSTGSRHAGFSSCRSWALESGISSYGSWTELPTACEIFWTRDQTGVPCTGRQILNHWASMVAQIVKNLLAMQGTSVLSLGREDPLEKGVAPHFSILAWRIPWTEKPGTLQSMESQRVRHD